MNDNRLQMFINNKKTEWKLVNMSHFHTIWKCLAATYFKPPTEKWLSILSQNAPCCRYSRLSSIFHLIFIVCFFWCMYFMLLLSTSLWIRYKHCYIIIIIIVKVMVPWRFDGCFRIFQLLFVIMEWWCFPFVREQW